MKAQKWLTIFLSTSLLILVIIAGLNIYIDPFKNYNQSWRFEYVSDRNGRYSKLQRLKKAKSTQCLVLGSSRSEFIFPEDIEEVTGLKTFTSAMGGAYTYTKYVYGLEGIKHLPNLKQIWYVSDFFEFNEKTIPWMLAELDEFKPYFLDQRFDELKPALSRKLKSLFSWELTRQSMKTISDYLRNKKRHYLADGSTKTSVTRRDFKSLEKEIKKVEHFYFLDNWKDYRELSDVSIEMIEKLVGKATQNQIVFKVMLTPIHPQLLKSLKEHSHLKRLWEQWRESWKDLADQDKIQLYDFTESERYIGNDGNYWHDGVHFSRESSKEFIFRMKGE